MVRSDRVRLTEAGWDADLAYERREVELDPPKRDQVLVEVKGCGVAYRDLVDREGRFPYMRLPITPGHEAAGRVIAIGPKVTEWAVGDAVGTMHRDSCGRCKQCEAGEPSLCPRATWVFGLMVDGGYAQHLYAPEKALYRLPDDLDLEVGCMLHSTYGTAYRGLVTQASTQAGERVLITGANGGVGSGAVQIAKRLGASVVAVVRDERHTDFLTGLGADEVLVDTGERIHKQLKGRVDVVLDCVGPPTINSAMRCATLGGRVVIIGNVNSDRVPMNLGYLIVNGLRLIGSSGANRRDMAGLLAMHAEAPFELGVHERLPLSQADAAQRKVKAGGNQGRIVLVPGLSD